jgi:outer membrane protein OmpA-like peptidoglycan-associated protein
MIMARKLFSIASSPLLRAASAALLVTFSGSIALTGCGGAPPPKELLDARTAYDRAKDSVAKELAPADLDNAKQALRRAEQAFEDEPTAQKTKDQAYVAHRLALLAELAGQIEEANKRKTKADSDYQEARDDALARQQLALKRQQDQLEKERLAREEEERKRQEEERKRKAAEAGLEQAEKDKLELQKQLEAALKSLKEIAQINEDKRGVVITLSGEVLFETGKYNLKQLAKDKLDKVVAALKDQGWPPLRIEGHTDTQGLAGENQKLSQDRASSVKDYLVSQGYPKEKITAVGMGQDHPVAENTTPEGRANNRRVEIVVNPK